MMLPIGCRRLVPAAHALVGAAHAVLRIHILRVQLQTLAKNAHGLAVFLAQELRLPEIIAGLEIARIQRRTIARATDRRSHSR